MLKRLPLMIDGRDVRLETIDTPPKADKSLGKYGPLWKLIMAKAGDGKWYTIAETQEFHPNKLKRTHDALRNRAFFSGFTQSVLKIWATVMDGICFQWTYNKDIMDKIPSFRIIREERMQRHRARKAKALRFRKARADSLSNTESPRHQR